MPKYCCAFGCNNKSGPDSGYHFHSFPKNEVLRKEWLNKIKRDGFQPSQHSVLCSAHFEPTAYLQGLATLKPDSVPIIFSHRSVTPTRISTAALKRQRLETSEKSGTVLTKIDLPATATAHCASSTFPNVRTSSDIGVQTETDKIKMIHVHTQTDDHVSGSLGTSRVEEDCDYDDHDHDHEDHERESDNDDEDCDNDEDYHMSSEHQSTDDDNSDPTDDGGEYTPLGVNANVKSERKFMVFESCLVQLLLLCLTCLANCTVHIRRICGGMLVVEQCCAMGHTKVWHSQPTVGTMPIGNLITASSILLTGSSPVRVLNMFRLINIPTIGLRTYMRMQSCYLIPAIRRVWLASQTELLSIEQDRGRVVGGDARCCSPGHTAKFSSYSIVDLQTSKILDLKLVQVSEVKNSNAMELEGLKRCLSFLQKFISITSITTDHHVSVKKYLREQLPHITHYFDVWHVAKSIKKKIDAKGKRSDCSILADWSHAVSNHLYWCAASSDGNGELVVAKWLSVLRHVVDIHEQHGPLFTECQHGDLPPRLWLQPDSKPHKELTIIVSNKLLCRDIKQLSPAEQTSALESYHRIVIFFAPKSIHFQYECMEARLLLAALHFNENCKRAQAATGATRELRWSVSYPKARKGEAVIKEVKVPPTFDYTDIVLDEIFALRESYPTYNCATLSTTNEIVPKPLASLHARANKPQLLAAHKSRFNK